MFLFIIFYELACFSAITWGKSCWNIHPWFLNRWRPASLTSGSGISFLYISEFIFNPFGIKTRFVLELAVTTPQTMTERGFWTRSTSLTSSGMSLTVVDKILSFWRFVASSTVKGFSSEKRMFFRILWCEPREESLASFESLLANWWCQMMYRLSFARF